MLSCEGRVLHCNPVASAFWGKAACCQPELDLPTIMEIPIPELIERFKENDEAIVRTLQLKIKNRSPQVANPSAWIRFTIAPIRDDNGLLTQILISHQDISDEVYSRQVIENTAQGVSAISGQGFFESLVTHLARIFDARYAFIGLLNEAENDRREIKTLALSANGVIADNFSYSLKNTPCDNVFGQSTCAICNGVQELYPDDILLKEMNIEGYIGSPIFDPNGHPLGIMVVMDTKPLERVDQVKSILEIFAARAGAEIQRLDAEQQIHRMAYEDYLTHLPNRASLYRKLQSLIHRPKTGEPEPHSALFMIDLDHFKTINDALGHDVGDEIIRKAGERLRQTLPE
ncbi:diguanylate cyclase, partial [Oceanospirillum sp. HFRX-1_2]